MEYIYLVLIFHKQIKYTLPITCHIYNPNIKKILPLVIKLRKWGSYFKVHISKFMFYDSRFIV